MNPSSADIGGFIVILSVLLGIYAKLQAAQKNMVEQIKLQLRSEAQPITTVIAPQPLIVEMREKFTSRESFESHARLNREAHEKIEKAAVSATKELAGKFEHLAREVSELNAVRSENATRIYHIDTKIDKLLERNRS